MEEAKDKTCSEYFFIEDGSSSMNGLTAISEQGKITLCIIGKLYGPNQTSSEYHYYTSKKGLVLDRHDIFGISPYHDLQVLS